MKTKYAQQGAIKAKTRNKVVVGLFVTKSILQGERIIEELPLLTFPPGSFTSDAIAHSFYDLEANEQFQIGNLSAPEIDGVDELTSIFQAHTFRDEDETRRFFLSASYIRHSCCPNAIVDWNANTGCLTVHALRAMEPTEELLICYVNSMIPFPRRWEIIRDEFGLDCACLRCSPNKRPGTNHVRIAELEELLAQYEADPTTWHREHPATTPLAIVQELIEKQAGISTSTPMELTYRRAAKFSELAGDLDAALKYAKLEVKNCVDCWGGDSMRTEDALAWKLFVEGLSGL